MKNTKADQSQEVDPNLGGSPNLILNPAPDLNDLPVPGRAHAPNLNPDLSREVRVVAVVQIVMLKTKRKKLSRKLLAEILMRRKWVEGMRID